MSHEGLSRGVGFKGGTSSWSHIGDEHVLRWLARCEARRSAGTAFSSRKIFRGVARGRDGGSSLKCGWTVYRAGTRCHRQIDRLVKFRVEETLATDERACQACL